jgi:4,5-DOPA dioxygenase extradiol
MSFEVLYIPHGGGPMPLLGEPGHAKLAGFLREVPTRLARPEAILVISAHWESDVATTTDGARPDLIYDYYGFPEESYRIAYPAPGLPALATRIRGLLEAAGLPARGDAARGFDHGLFVPLKLMYPDARIPCVQLSLLRNLSPEEHVAIGRALAPLRDDNILVLGSGFSFHNMRALMDPEFGDDRDTDAFQEWLIETCCGREFATEHRERRLIDWANAPGARFCHPRAEHLLPLHVCCAMAATRAGVVFDDRVMSRRAVGFLWQAA